ncbi:MAG TPA: RHS repeat-associated core domain-containing protein [Flavisolibacter sp.]|nr:RHS repeat-associated core domain-containing protein [Flavisolibacter sp.]
MRRWLPLPGEVGRGPKNFDAWGRNRNPGTWQYANIPSVPVWLYRGYTGHEHLKEFALINMNGRMYDPVQGRMLSPDNYVPTPFGTQGYNRYSYALNNPLVYSDPDGNLPIALIAIPLIKALAVGAGIGAVGYTTSIAFSDGGFRNFSSNGLLSSMGIGAVSGLVSFGIGSAFVTAGSIGKEIMRGYAHGFSSGLISAATGGSFQNGFLSGAFGSLSGSAISNYVYNPLLLSGASVITGGIGSELSGGNFWQGAALAGIISLVNHGWHEQRPDADGVLTLEEANKWARIGKGKPLYVDANKLDLGWVRDEGWSRSNRKGVQTFLNAHFGDVYGNITLERVGPYTAKILPDIYDFEQHGSFLSSPVRNSATWVGKMRASRLGFSRIQPFTIHFNGMTSINQPLKPYLIKHFRGPKL